MPQPPRQFARDQRRLVEPAAPQPRAMQRHRHQKASSPSRDQRRHVARHRPRERDLAPIFEADGDFATSRHRPPRRASARCAAAARGRHAQMLRIGRFQRDSARRAAAFAEEFDLVPAIGAKTARPRRRSCRIRRSAAARRNPQLMPGPPLRSDPALIAPCRRRAAAHKRRRATDMFDMPAASAAPRPRRARGPELFLYERAFDDCLDRLAIVQRPFGSALLIGCPSRMAERLGSGGPVDV